MLVCMYVPAHVCVRVCECVWEKEKDLSFLYKYGVVGAGTGCDASASLYPMADIHTHKHTPIFCSFSLTSVNHNTRITVQLLTTCQILYIRLPFPPLIPPVGHPFSSLHLSISKQHYCICVYNHIRELIKQKRDQ